MNTQLMGIIRTQKITEQAVIRRDDKNEEEKAKGKSTERSKFVLEDKSELKSVYAVTKALRGEQVKDIMQCMQSQSISKMVRINDIAG